MKRKIVYSGLIVVTVLALLGSGFSLGLVIGKKYPGHITVTGISNVENQGANADFSTFWEAWQIISDNYLRNASTTNQQKVYGAAEGFVNSLGDPYTVFFSPKNGKMFEENVQGNFGGIGAEIGMKKNQIVIIAPLKGSPSERAGIKAGDTVLKVNSTSTDGLTVDQAVAFIRGPKGTPVTLSVFREGWDRPHDIAIVRDTIETPTLDFSMKGSVAYVQLYSFNSNSDRLFYDAMRKAQAAGAQGLVLDLRNNPGGYLDVAVDLAGWFVKKGTAVVSEAGRSGIIDTLKTQGNEALIDFPAVVLVNGGSASAAEILAGILRDLKHVLLVGTQTFGKGTVQQLIPLPDGSSVKVTVAHWVLPSGTILENGGLKPDIKVETIDADAKANRDPQLDAALGAIKKQIGR